MVVAGCCGDAGGNIDEGEGGVGGGKEEGPLPLLYPLLLLGDAIVIIVLFGDGVALNEPGREAGEMTWRVSPVALPCAFIAIASTLAGRVGNSLIVFCACVGGALEALGGILEETWWI